MDRLHELLLRYPRQLPNRIIEYLCEYFYSPILSYYLCTGTHWSEDLSSLLLELLGLLSERYQLGDLTPFFPPLTQYLSKYTLRGVVPTSFLQCNYYFFRRDFWIEFLRLVPEGNLPSLLTLVQDQEFDLYLAPLFLRL